MSKAQASALSVLAVAIVTVLVSRGVITGETASDVQSVILAAIAFGATVGIRSARK